MSRAEPIAALIDAHLDRYPRLEVMDLYKLLHQAVFGPGHSILNAKSAREWLDRESEQVIPNADELLTESIHPDGAMVRIHLRPYLAQHGDLNDLLDGYIQSSKVVAGDLTTMAAWWGIAQNLTAPAAPLADRFDHRTVLLMGRTRASEQWPAGHHSPAYEQHYKPYYRVLTRSIAEALLKDQHIPFRVG
ncbi:MAG TPA: hypothetical protein VMT34_08265 [Aggregatilineales bacterium]|nr:hypothetical protein [Aggregatilineales bacterium]